MAVQYAPTKLRVPPGFQNILEGLSREVLREQPGNIIQFAANYFKDQLLIRNETGKDDAKKGSDMEKLQQEEEIDIDLNDPSTADAALKIQAVFRGHKGRKETKQKKEEEEAATKIQAGFRGHQARKSVKEMQSSSVGSVANGSVVGEVEKEEGEYVESVIVNEGVDQGSEMTFDDPKYEQAATKIQAGFRGYKTREEMSERLSKSNAQEDKEKPAEGASDEVNQGEGDPGEEDKGKEEEAAVKIQASFRGHVARKEVAAMKSSSNEMDAEEKVGEDASRHEAAAVKIQSNYRGYVGRKEVDALKSSQGGVKIENEEGEDSAETKEPVEGEDEEQRAKAATRIQASYRGYRTRVSMKSDSPPDLGKASEDEPAQANDATE